MHPSCPASARRDAALPPAARTATGRLDCSADCRGIAADSPARASSLIRTAILCVLTALAGVPVARAALLIGVDVGGTMRLVEGSGPAIELAPFGPDYLGAVRVAMGDVDGDGVADLIAGAGFSAGGKVRVLDGLGFATLHAFDAYPDGFLGGVRVATADIDGDGRADIVVAPDAGQVGPVKVFSGRTGGELLRLHPFGVGFTGGISVAAGDIDGDRRADIVVAAASATATRVRAFSGSSGVLLRSFDAFPTQYTGGVSVAVGDWTGDGVMDIVVGAGTDDGSGNGPRVRIFDGLGAAQPVERSVFEPGFRGGVRVAVGEAAADGGGDLIVASGPGRMLELVRFRAADAGSTGETVVFDSGYGGGGSVALAVEMPIAFGDGFEPPRLVVADP
jgi:hypothetical protein